MAKRTRYVGMAALIVSLFVLGYALGVHRGSASDSATERVGTKHEQNKGAPHRVEQDHTEASGAVPVAQSIKTNWMSNLPESVRSQLEGQMLKLSSIQFTHSSDLAFVLGLLKEYGDHPEVGCLALRRALDSDAPDCGERIAVALGGSWMHYPRDARTKLMDRFIRQDTKGLHTDVVAALLDREEDPYVLMYAVSSMQIAESIESHREALEAMMGKLEDSGASEQVRQLLRRR